MSRLEGKVAFVTGAARGQGASHAVEMARAGADILMVDVADNLDGLPYALATEDDLEETRRAVEAEDRRCVALVADVRSQESLDEAVAAGIARLGAIDILVANAGIWDIGPFWELSEEQFHATIDVNLAGVWRSAKAVAPHMIERRSGSMVLISSVNAMEGGLMYAHYVASKHGVLGLMRSFAIELAPYNIRCNTICPGIVDTKQHDWQGAYDMMKGGPGGTPEDRVQAGRHGAMLAGRGLLPPRSISNAVIFLASDDSSDITGQALPVDGGHLTLLGVNPAPL